MRRGDRHRAKVTRRRWSRRVNASHCWSARSRRCARASVARRHRLERPRARVTPDARRRTRGVRHALDEARTRRCECARQERLDASARADEAEVERHSCDEALREATDWAARTEAHAEALARALDELSGAGGRAIIGDLEGVLGAFLDLIEIDARLGAGRRIGRRRVGGRDGRRRTTVGARGARGAAPRKRRRSGPAGRRR